MASFSSFPAISSPPSSLTRPSSPTPLTSHYQNRSALSFSHVQNRSALSFSHVQNRLCRFGVRCSYAEQTVSDSAPIDVVADVKTERVVVLGGSGFVGSAICKAAVSKGIEVISLSRSGRPTSPSSWVDQVNWIAGDVFYVNWDEVIVGATAVVSTLGGFGSEEQMKRINGEANVVAVNAAKDYGGNHFGNWLWLVEYNIRLSSTAITKKIKTSSILTATRICSFFLAG